MKKTLRDTRQNLRLKRGADQRRKIQRNHNQNRRHDFSGYGIPAGRKTLLNIGSNRFDVDRRQDSDEGGQNRAECNDADRHRVIPEKKPEKPLNGFPV